MTADASRLHPPDDIPPGRRPTPLHDLLGIRVMSIGGGRAHFELTVGPGHLRSHGIVHGGVMAALLDATIGNAAASLAPPGHDLVTAQLNINFIRPVRLGETLVGRAQVDHSGRRTAVAHGDLRTDTGALAATGSGTFLYLPPAAAEQGGIRPEPWPDAGS